MKNILIQGRKISLCLNQKRDIVIYLHLDSFEEPSLLSNFPKDCSYVIIQGCDWDKDFTPYPHKKVFHGGEDFLGGGKEYLSLLTKEIIPTIEKEGNLHPLRRGIAGYSLAGLFAFYAGIYSDCFSDVVSASGSLWYPDFIESLEKESFSPSLKNVYLSLGDRESKTKNAYLSQADFCMQKALVLLENQNRHAVYVPEKGGHFENTTVRLKRGIQWILQQS